MVRKEQGNQNTKEWKIREVNFIVLRNGRWVLTLVSRGRCSRKNRAAGATCGHGRCELPATLRLTPRSLAASDFFCCGRRSEKPCDFRSGMVASPLAATVFIAILRCDFCATKFLTHVTSKVYVNAILGISLTSPCPSAERSFCKKDEIFETKSPKSLPRFAPKCLMRSWQVAKSDFHISPDISCQR